MPIHTATGPQFDHPAIDWEVVEGIHRRARTLRSEAFAQAFGAPWRWLRLRVAQARTPLDFAPCGTCQ